MERKEFIKIVCSTILGSTSLGTIVQSCASTNYFVTANTINNKIVIKKEAFTKHRSAVSSSGQKFLLVRTELSIFPIYVYKFSEENFSALLMKCTHLGCELQPNGDYLVCPCHGSEFTNRGEVQHPPADKNLQKFKVTTDYENIYIHLF